MRRVLIGHAGLVCDVTNPNEYATALVAALEKEWNNAPIEQSLDFSWETVAQRYSEVIESLIPK